MTPAGGAAWTVVHDFAFVQAGAERVVSAMAQRVVPDAPVLMLAGSDDVVADMGLARTRWLLPRRAVTQKSMRALTVLYGPVLSRLAPVQGDVLCSSYAFAHHVRATGRKVVYCHSPLRQIWSGRDLYGQQASFLERSAVRLMTRTLRRKDVQASRSADLYVASSEVVRRRIEEHYGRFDVPVVSPPIDTCLFYLPSPARERRSYLWVGRVTEPYKRLGMTIEAFRQMPDRHLDVVGDGPDRLRLQATAPPNVDFLGWRQGSELARLYGSARAVIFPSEDDFGLVPVEAMACGTPTIAYRAGGAEETVVDGVTGLFFDTGTVRALREAVDDFEKRSWDAEAIAARSAPYHMDAFVTRMRALLEALPT